LLFLWLPLFGYQVHIWLLDQALVLILVILAQGALSPWLVLAPWPVALALGPNANRPSSVGLALDLVRNSAGLLLLLQPRF